MNNNNKLPDLESVEVVIPGSESSERSGGVAGASLPCLFRNNSIEKTENKIQEPLSDDVLRAISVDKKYRKSSVALSCNVLDLSFKHGLKNLGFLTLTFKDHVTDYREGSKRFNSLASNVLNVRYKHWLRVMERQKSGRIHYHLIVALDDDIRTDFNFAEASEGIYKSASKSLRAEWAFWRKTAPLYRFGRTELLPIKSSHEAIGRYVGKYIGKHMMQRLPEDKGARLVSYSKGCRAMSTKFSWHTEGAQEWRAKVKVFAHMVAERRGCEPTFEGLALELGPKWAYNNREFIAQLPV